MCAKRKAQTADNELFIVLDFVYIAAVKHQELCACERPVDADSR